MSQMQSTIAMLVDEVQSLQDQHAISSMSFSRFCPQPCTTSHLSYTQQACLYQINSFTQFCKINSYTQINS
jgi:hypothetical protein